MRAIGVTGHGTQVAVGPNGEVYVVYEVFYVGNQNRQFRHRQPALNV